MSKELDDAYFRSTPCTHHEPLLSKLVDCVDLLEERIKGLLGATVSVGETETLPAGSEATAKASKRGYDTVLDFGIPRGEPGSDGYSPTANVTKNGGTATITVTDKNGTTTATVSDGAPGSDANVTKENVETALGYEPLKGLSIAGATVQSDGGVADVPIASLDKYGAVKSGSASDGVYVDSNGVIKLQIAGISQIDGRSTRYQPINPQFLDYAVKAAMCDGKGAAWTVAEQAAAKIRMGITEGSSSGSRLWFSRQAPGTDIEASGYFNFKLSFLACSEALSPIDNVKAGDTVLWNGYAYFVADNDGTSASGDTRLEFAPHKA